MQINIKQLETGGFSEEKSLDFAYELDLSQVRQWGQAPYREPARVTGGAASRLGFLTIRYTVDCVRRDLCARCLSPVERKISRSFTHSVMERSGDDEGRTEPDEDIVLPADGLLDIDELVIADLLLDQDPVILCSPECKGLCPRCGANLNEAACSCAGGPEDAAEPESHFAALLELMDDNE